MPLQKISKQFHGRSSSLYSTVAVVPKLALVGLLGLGAHISKNALAPAQPELERLGLQPIQYAAVSAMPVVGSIVFPIFWGKAYERCERVVLIMVPAGVLFGQVMLSIGLQLHVIGSSLLLVRWVLILALVVLSASRGGGEVLQHVILVRSLPPGENLTNAFVLFIFVTHSTLVLCNWAVPRLIQDGSGWTGIIRAQLVFSLPSILSVIAAYSLARSPATSGTFRLDAVEPLLVVPNRVCNNDQSVATVVIDAPLTEAETCGTPRETSTLSMPAGALPRHCPYRKCCCRHLASSPLRQQRTEQSWLGSVSLIVWGALMLGLLHAFQTVTNEYLVSRGLSATDAGSIVAQNQVVALAFLPFVGMLTHVMGQRILLFLTSLLTLGASINLLLGPEIVGIQAFQAALLVFAIAGVIAPILPLALIPANCKALGKSYGMLDSLKSLMQLTNMLMIGALREGEHGGFHYVIIVLTLELVVATLVSVSLMRTLVETGNY